MTVEAAQKMWSKNKLDYTSPDGRRRKIRITNAYSVVTEATDEIEDVLEADDLPRIMDLYPDSVQIRATKITPMQISPIYYIVQVDYEGEVEGQSFGDNPTDANPTIRWRNLITEEEIDEAYSDEDGSIVPIATANHERVRGITERVVDWVAIIERNYAFGAFDLPTMHEYLRSVNDDNIVTNLGTFGPGIARLTKFEPKEVYRSEDDGYVKVNAEVTFRYPYNLPFDETYKAWYKRYLHEGYIMRVRPDSAPADGSEDRLINCLDDNRDTSLRPLLLDEEGFPIADPTDPSTPPHYRMQRTLIELPYAALGLF